MALRIYPELMFQNNDATHNLNVQIMRQYSDSDMMFFKKKLCNFMNRHPGYKIDGHRENVKIWWTFRGEDDSPIFDTKNNYSDQFVKQYVSNIIREFKNSYDYDIEWTVTKMIH